MKIILRRLEERNWLVMVHTDTQAVPLALEQLPVWTTEKHLLKTKQGRTLVSYSKWKCPGIKSRFGLGLPLERTPLLFSTEQRRKNMNN